MDKERRYFRTKLDICYKEEVDGYFLNSNGVAVVISRGHFIGPGNFHPEIMKKRFPIL